jgi:hypothetical protein
MEAFYELCTEDASRSAINRFGDAVAALWKAALDPDLLDQATMLPFYPRDNGNGHRRRYTKPVAWTGSDRRATWLGQERLQK